MVKVSYVHIDGGMRGFLCVEMGKSLEEGCRPNSIPFTLHSCAPRKIKVSRYVMYNGWN